MLITRVIVCRSLSSYFSFHVSSQIPSKFNILSPQKSSILAGAKNRLNISSGEHKAHCRIYSPLGIIICIEISVPVLKRTRRLLLLKLTIADHHKYANAPLLSVDGRGAFFISPPKRRQTHEYCTKTAD